ncbi:hypothetical protein D3C76_573080 [compost metagenome]
MLEGDVQLIEHHQPDTRVAQQLTGNSPGGFGGGDIALAVLGFPGEALAHDMEAHLFGKTSVEQLLSRAVAALDELHHAALHAMAHGPGEHAERRTALALAVAGQHQQQPTLIRRTGNAFVDHGFLAQHARQVALVTFAGISFAGSSHRSSPLTRKWAASTKRHDRQPQALAQAWSWQDIVNAALTRATDELSKLRQAIDCP